MIAKIAVSAATFAIDKPYSYRIPEGMELLPGQRVIVPFGWGNRRCEGVVLSLGEEELPNLKTVEDVLDEEAVLSAYQLRMAAFIRERYFCTFYDAIRAILPAGLWFRSSEILNLTEDRTWQEKPPKNQDALAVLQFLDSCGGKSDVPHLKNVVVDEDCLQKAVQYLSRKKWVAAKADFLRRGSDKTERIAALAVEPEEAMAYAAKCTSRSAMQRSVLELMCSVGCVSVKELCYYTGASTATVKRLSELGFLALTEKPVLRCKEIIPAQLDGPLTLEPEQQTCLEGLDAQAKQEHPGAALLYGVTGSGKTSVYLKLIENTLERGRSAMLLVPEIALTPQLLSLLAAYFGQTVAVLHSSLSAGERFDQWKRVKAGDARVVVGTRSAVFAPAKDLGLLILDEEQEHSYRSENNPRYDAREVSLWRGAHEHALVLLGSATPSVETMYHAKNGDYRLYTLSRRYGGRPLPEVSIVDMRQEIKEGNDLVFSRELQEAMMDTMEAKKQTILLLNRRGNSRALVCVDCRKTPECPRCSVRLTYHSANNRLMCHYCGYSQPAPQRCPTCGGPLKQIGVGTQKVQQELEYIFPTIESDRMDTDTVSAVNTHEKILNHFRDNHVPVLIGTQMVAKGLNLPDVTLVGVLDADLSLYSSSYRAAETTFNMLTQVVGRAGRGDTPGRAILQTMSPEHEVITLAAQQNYDGFYDLEIRLRQIQQAPPFGELASVTFQGKEETAVLRGAMKFRDSLIGCLQQPEYSGEVCTVLGPAPCVVPKVNYSYRYCLTLRCRMTKQLRGLIAYLLRQFSQDKLNREVSAFADVNGFET